MVAGWAAASEKRLADRKLNSTSKLADLLACSCICGDTAATAEPVSKAQPTAVEEVKQAESELVCAEHACVQYMSTNMTIGAGSAAA